MLPGDTQALVLETCECSKKILAVVTKLRVLRGSGYSELCEGNPKCINYNPLSGRKVEDLTTEDY